jgi:hypothetical protein
MAGAIRQMERPVAANRVVTRIISFLQENPSPTWLGYFREPSVRRTRDCEFI